MAGVGGLHCVHGQGADGVGEFSGSGFHGRREEAKGGIIVDALHFFQSRLQPSRIELATP
jgi:hypothetical protein